MIKKIIFITIAIAIIATGFIGFNKLNYWPKSVRIFGYKTDQANNITRERGHDGYEGSKDFQSSRSLADRNSISPDGSRQDRNYQRPQRDESGRGGTRNGKEINLRNVWWYLSVFAAVAVLAIYSDKILKYAINRVRTE